MHTYCPEHDSTPPLPFYRIGSDPFPRRSTRLKCFDSILKVWLICLGASNGTMVDESRLDPFFPKLVYWPTEKGHSHLSMAFGLSLR